MAAELRASGKFSRYTVAAERRSAPRVLPASTPPHVQPKVAFLTKTTVGARWLLPLVSAAMEEGMRAKVYLPPGDGDLAPRLCSSLGVEIERTQALGPSPRRAVAALPSLRRSLHTFDPDIVNYFLYRAALVARAATLGGRAKRVHSVPGPLFYESQLVTLVERFAGRWDHRVFAGSEAVRSAALESGVPAEGIRVVRFGADFSSFVPPTPCERLQARRLLGLPLQSPVFVVVARWYAPKRLALGGRDVKGHDVLLRAWERYVATGGGGHLVVMGGGIDRAGSEYRTSILSSIPSSTRSSITCLDTAEDVRVAYRAGDVSISPSRSENYGAAVEAAAMQVPTIASAVGGLPEVVIPKVTGWLVSPDDSEALATAIHDAEEAILTGEAGRLGTNARTSVGALLDWPIVTSSYLRELRDLLR